MTKPFSQEKPFSIAKNNTPSLITHQLHNTYCFPTTCSLNYYRRNDGGYPPIMRNIMVGSVKSKRIKFYDYSITIIVIISVRYNEYHIQTSQVIWVYDWIS